MRACRGAHPSPTAAQACGCNRDCDVGEVCADESLGFPGGECVRVCSSTTVPCPTGFACIALTPNDPSTETCLPRCTTSAECRPGYACGVAAGVSNDTFCIGLCQSNAECASVGVCDLYYGTCGLQPHAGTREVGAACARDADCISNLCLVQPEFPNGSCSAFCSLTAHGCPAGSSCDIRLGPAGEIGLCLHACARDADCRAGYRCLQSAWHPDRLVCGT